jgi:hypothetical protein
MPASQTRSVSYRIGEAASGGMGAISQPANQSESGPGHSRRSDGQQGFVDVRYAFNGDRICASQRTDAMCQQQSLALAHSITSSAQYSPFAERDLWSMVFTPA